MSSPGPGPEAIVLLSGGLDSTTVLLVALERGFAVHALTFRYGQRHEHEVEAAQRIARRYGVRSHTIASIDLRAVGGSTLTGEGEVPKDRALESMAAGIPATYVPARNTIFLSYALACAEVRAAADVFIGVNALDYSGYPDCRPEYIEAFERMANLATRAAVEAGRRLTIHAPLIRLTKREIVQLGLSLGVDYGLTTSCYDPTAAGEACGRCDACRLRLRGFHEAGARDPIRYAGAALPS
jgi:7-cyano-7-deazaguanine synthase